MTDVELVDATLRDGQQSLWGMRMQAGMALPVADIVDRTGYRIVDATGSSFMEVLVKYCREDPWAGLDLLRGAIHRTPMRAGMRGNACVSFGVTPPALMDLWMRRLNEHGVRSFWIYDTLYGVENFARLARIAKEYASEVVGTVFFSQSPVHTDEYLAGKAREIAAVPEIDGVLFYDTAGVLHTDRLRTLVPQIVAAAGGKPVEFHSNNLMGTSGLAYVEAAQLGIHILHTASRSMANGPSVPSTESVVRNLEMLGYAHSIDQSLLAPVAEHFRAVGHAAGYLVDAVSEYDLFNVTHQVPGGMLGTLRAQLEQHGMADRIDEVLTETGAVRRELGWPVMATPLSQLVGTQAVLNIVTGDRYSMVPDELVNYALGRYGEPPAPIEAEVRDRILSGRRAAEIAATAPDAPTLEELRRRYRTDDDDLLILKALIPEEDIAAMQASGPPRRDYPLGSGEVDEIRTLMAIARAPYVHIANARFELELRR
jgi:oxaloacetate decarboxylase (Na+ extruding) subunit alpha